MEFPKWDYPTLRSILKITDFSGCFTFNSSAILPTPANAVKISHFAVRHNKCYNK